MASLFGSPKIPTPQPAPPAPTVDDARLAIEESRRRRTMQGRAATQVVQNETPVATAARQLTGN